MNNKLMQEALLPNIYLIRDEDVSSKPDKKPSYYGHHSFKESSYVAFEGIDILDQIPSGLNDYVSASLVKNSFTNIKIVSFYNRTYSSSEIQLQVCLPVSKTEEHYLSCSDISMRSILQEAIISEGIIKSECCFIPSGNTNSINVLVVKGGETYNEFIEQVEKAKGLKSLTFKLLKTGQIYNLPSSWRKNNIYLGSTYSYFSSGLINPELREDSIPKHKVFLDLDDENLSSLKKIIKNSDQSLLDNENVFTSYWSSPIVNVPKYDDKKKVEVIESSENFKNLNFNKIFKRLSGLNNGWCWDPKYIFKSREDVIKFHRELHAKYTNPDKDKVKSEYKTYISSISLINFTDD